MSGDLTSMETTFGNTDDRNEWIEFVHFHLGDDSYMLELGRVEKIVRDPSVTSVPQSGPAIAGVANLGGVIPVIIDGRALLELPPRPPVSDPTLLVLDRDNAQTVGVLVDTVVGIDAHHVDHIKPPATLEQWPLPLDRRWFRAVVREPDRPGEQTGVFDMGVILDEARAQS